MNTSVSAPRSIMDKQDMSSLGVADGGKVLVENEVGRVVLTARTISDKSWPGVGVHDREPLVPSAGGGRALPLSGWIW